MNTKNCIFLQLLIVSTYIISLFTLPSLANILLILHHFVAAFIIVCSIKVHHTFKLNWGILALAPLFIGLALFIVPLSPFFRSMASLVILTASIYYFVRNIKRWHRTQLIIDIIVILVIFLGLFSALFITKIDASALSPQEYIGLLSIMVIDLISLIIMLVMISSIRISRIPRGLQILVIGMLFFILSNMFGVYNIFFNIFSFATFVFSMQLIAFSLFAIGSTIPNFKLSIVNDFRRNGSPENLYKNRLALWLALIPLILFALGFINLTYLTIIIMTVVIYQFLSFYIHKTAIMEILLDQDEYLKDKLEALVDDRTIELTKANKALYDKSTLDDLTGLYNRSYFIQLLEEAIEIEGSRFSVAFMDLDRFKIINDLHGHDMGDKVLKIVAKRFTESRCNRCSYARVGGDEFAILFRSDHPDDLKQLSLHLLNVLKAPIVIDDYQFYVGVSIGIARFPKEAQSVKQLLKYADIAMYNAKNDDKSDKYVLYSSHLIEQIERRNYIELLLREANFERDFELYYQPKFDTKRKVLIGMEALLRWHHKTEGFITPSEFIPIAEESGMILKLSDWIFATAMSRIKVINSHYNAQFIMSMNVSPLSLDSISFLADFTTLIKRIGVDPSFIELEITEHSAMNTASRMSELCTAIGGLGVRVSIDDFGTGYSSLYYIKRFDIDELKIAKELVDNIEDNDNDRLIVKAIIMMAKGMGLSTIAEGVETPRQLNILEELGCDAIQGYIFGRPAPAAVFEETYLKKLR